MSENNSYILKYYWNAVIFIKYAILLTYISLLACFFFNSCTIESSFSLFIFWNRYVYIYIKKLIASSQLSHSRSTEIVITTGSLTLVDSCAPNSYIAGCDHQF